MAHSHENCLTSAIQKAKEYILFDINPQTKAEIQTLLDENKHEMIISLFGTRIAFGTAGLRAPMGPGYSRINDLIILQTSQGLAEYIIKVHGKTIAKESGIIIGYDHRRYQSMSSQRFARICAAVFLSQGCHVYLLENQVATPLVAFGVRHMKCIAGFMVTASHNPAKDNGFKMYWNNGAQIIPPHDQGVSDCIMNNLSPHQTYDIDNVLTHPLAKNVTDQVSQAYFSQLPRLSYYPHPQHNCNQQSIIKVAYTAMHGVGYQWVKQAFSSWGHKPFSPVPSQMHPDPDFPTVSFPNPEEKGALNEAMRFAEENECSLILANDPDADRLAVAERIVVNKPTIIPSQLHQYGDISNDIDSNSNKKMEVDDTASTITTDRDIASEWHVFTGNEIGVLLGHWMITQYKQQQASHVDSSCNISNNISSSKVAVLASIVSSRFLKKIAAVEGIDYYDTLTGFKWLANRSIELRESPQSPTTVLFAYEEALGYCISDLVCDKDGLSAACVFLEMANQLASLNSDKNNNNDSSSSNSSSGNGNSVSSDSSSSSNNNSCTTVYQHLKNLEAKYGVYVSYNSYVLSYDKNVTDTIFKRLRTTGSSSNGGRDNNNNVSNSNYFTHAGGVKVVSVKDITVGYDSTTADNKCDLPLTPDSHMIMYEFENGVTCTLRTSGTEPKIKYYTEIAGNPGQTKQELEQTLYTFVDRAIVEEMLQPSLHGLKRAS